MTRPALALLALAFAAASGCGGPPPSPEEEIRQMIAEAEEHASARDLPALRERIAEDYQDAYGRDRAEVVSIVRFHFLRNQVVHLLVRVREIEVDPKGRARVRALVATAGRPIPALEALADGGADLLWMDFEVARRDGEWAVTSAAWERARLEDLL